MTFNLLFRQRPSTSIAVSLLLAMTISPQSSIVQASVHSQPVAQACGTWEAVPVPFAGTDATFWSVDGTSANDVWAVGAFYSPLAHAQIQHWDGQQWNPVADGAADLPVTALRGVEVVAADDIWAVGLYNAVADGTGPIQPIIEHWDGQVWTNVPAPQAGVNAILTDVAAAAPEDIWAVGSASIPGGGNQALIQHWDGQRWTNVEPPALADMHALNGVAVVAPNDVWAVGRVNIGGVWSTLVEHWDGAAWSIVPSGTHPGGILNAIAVAGPDDIWAVGNATVSNTVVTLHWDGSTWTRFDNGLTAIALDDITVMGPDDAWAVGTGPDIGPLTAHWDGKSWNPVPSVTGFTLHSVQAFGPDDVWAVGQTRTESLSARYSDPCLRSATAPRVDGRPVD